LCYNLQVPAIGGTAATLIGNYMDNQVEEIQEDLEGAAVERIGEGILMTSDSELLIYLNSYQLRGAAQDKLRKLSGVLKKYEDTSPTEWWQESWCG